MEERSDRHDGTPVVTPARIVAGVCLLVQLVGLMWVSSYAREEPRLWGFPFFYWYQLLWVFIGAALTYVAYRAVVAEERLRRASRGRDDGSHEQEVRR